jgi:glutamyl-tRNA reductase
MTRPSLALVAAAYWHARVSDEDPPVWAQHEVPLQLARLREIDGVREVAIVATCNRTEVYLVADNASPAIQRVHAMGRETYTLGGPEAAEHLLRVACGLESGILGDGQILGQVRQAYATARAARSTGPLLNRLFETALRAGKRARHETGLGRGATTTASAAVEMVARLTGPLDGHQVLVVGAGETAKLAALHLARLRPSRLTVANRTRAHADAIATKVGGAAIDLAELPAALAHADVVVSATSGRRAVISADLVRQVMAARPDHPLLAVDLAVPRDIETPAGLVNGVRLLDLDCVQADASKNLMARESSVPQVETIVAEEACAFEAWRRGRSADDVIRALRARVDAEALDRQTQRLMNRILHPAILRLKTLAGNPEGDARLSQWRAQLEVPGAVRAAEAP